MLTLTHPIEAYRRDVGDNPSRETLTASDADLVQLGALLHRLTQLHGSDSGVLDGLRDEIEQTAARVMTREGRQLDPQRANNGSLWASAIQEAAEVAEDAGALRLANVILHLAYLSLNDRPAAVQHGRLMAQRARVARKANAVDQAQALYQETLSLGEELPCDELVARANIGFSILAHARGNLPAAISHIDKAIEPATRSNAREITALVHTQRMLYAALQSRFDDAVVLAWAAFRDVEGDTLREVSALANAGQILLDIGRPRVALRVFLAALSRRPPKRGSLPPLGGAAMAASVLRNESLVRRFVADIDELARGADLRFEVVLALGEAATALLPFAPEEAETRRAAVHEEAMRSQFHQLAFRFAQFATEVASKTQQDKSSVDFMRVVREVGELEIAAEYAGV